MDRTQKVKTRITEERIIKFKRD